MLEYFIAAQGIKKEIEEDVALIDRISSVFGYSQGDFIGEGSHNKVYRVCICTLSVQTTAS